MELTNEQILTIARHHFKEDADISEKTLNAYCNSVRAIITTYGLGLQTEAVAHAYGYLWHVTNPEPLAPEHVHVDVYRASYKARAALRDLLTTEQRGAAINAVHKLLSAPENSDADPT